MVEAKKDQFPDSDSQQYPIDQLEWENRDGENVVRGFAGSARAGDGDCV